VEGGVWLTTWVLVACEDVWLSEELSVVETNELDTDVDELEPGEVV